MNNPLILEQQNLQNWPPSAHSPPAGVMTTISGGNYPTGNAKDRRGMNNNGAVSSTPAILLDGDAGPVAMTSVSTTSVSPVLVGNVNVNEVVAVRKVQALEKSMEFIQKEHKETLLSLQAEVERLKKENNDLQFKTIMLTEESRELKSESIKGKYASQSKSNSNQSTTNKTAKLENEIRELRFQ